MIHAEKTSNWRFPERGMLKLSKLRANEVPGTCQREFGVRRQSEASTALCSEFRVYAAAPGCNVPPKDGAPKQSKAPSPLRSAG
ncbi:MAG: hypothetical protein ACXW18_10690, partial [Pyrinomonadaceae bacterium]